MLTDKIDAAVLRVAGPQLKIVANFAVGTDNIDHEACARAGVTITNTPDVLNQAVAEHTIALMFAAAKRIVETDGYIRHGKYHGWGPMLWLGTELGGKTLGIIGSGRIGSEVARIAHRGFDINILYTDVTRNIKLEKNVGAQFCSLDELLKKSDVVSLHVPLLPNTRHLIDTPQLKRMKRTALLINTARGAIVHEHALIHALKNKLIAGAALDVFEHEPNISAALKKLPNVVLTPHTASATQEARDGMSELCAENIVALLADKKPKTR